MPFPSLVSHHHPYTQPHQQRAGIDYDHQDHCQLCFEGGDLLCCDHCPVSFHKECLGREFRSGLAEVIKYGFIYDAAFLAWLEDNLGKLAARDPVALTHAIRRSCEIKAEVVAQDERESGIRAWLNFGHTFGHAVEAGMGYGAWLHGEAVAAGMVVAAALSANLGHISQTDAGRVKALVQRAGLPVTLPRLFSARYLDLMRVDKKADAGTIRYVLLKSLGAAFVAAVPDAQVLPVLEAHSEPK